MSIISQKKYEEADDQVKKIWDEQVDEHGRMTNMKRTLAHSHLALRSFMEFYPLQKEVQEFLGERATIIFVHALSSETDCLICSTYFRHILKDWGEDPDNLAFDEDEQRLIDFAHYLVKDSNNVPQTLLEQLKEKYSEKGLVLLTAFAGIMLATNVFNNALKIDLDEYLYEYRK